MIPDWGAGNIEKFGITNLTRRAGIGHDQGRGSRTNVPVGNGTGQEGIRMAASRQGPGIFRAQVAGEAILRVTGRAGRDFAGTDPAFRQRSAGN